MLNRFNSGLWSNIHLPDGSRDRHRHPANYLFLLYGLSAPGWAELSVSTYASLINDNSQVISGGVSRDFTSRLLIDAGIEIQQQQHFLFISYQAQRGQNGSDSVGDIQAYSNIDEDNFNRIYEFFYQYQWHNGYIKLGKNDANAEFAVADPGGDFINSSMGFSPTIVGFPTYPSPALSLLGSVNLNQDWQLAAGVFAAKSSTNFAEQFYISELRYQISPHSQIKLGIWHDTNRFESLDESAQPRRGETGYYLIGQKELAGWHWFNSRQINWYCQLGQADERSSEIKWHLGSGVEFTAPFAMDGHGMGFGLSRVELSQHVVEQHDSETALEFYYFWSANDHLLIKPDLQYIIRPSGSGEINDALVFTLRLELSL